MTSTASLPVLDISDIHRVGDVPSAALAEQMRNAALRYGFFYVTGHGLSAQKTDSVFSQSKNFFSQPVEKKLELDMAKSFCNRGYEPMKRQSLQADANPDLKEGFYIGVDLPLSDPRVIGGKFNYGPNVWPDYLPEFRQTMDQYFGSVLEVSRKLLSVLACSLGLPHDYFVPFSTDPSATLRLLHYPPQEPNPKADELGCGAHTDFGSITILLQDDVGGLQILDDKQGWIDAPPVPGSFIVNLGDLISRWTNGRYKSNLHRVINKSGRDRYSIPFFMTGNPDYVVECLEVCLEPGEKPKFPPTTTLKHLEECYRRTYG